MWRGCLCVTLSRRWSSKGDWPEAAAYWGSDAVAAAPDVADASNGVHHSFERTDSVDCQAIYGSVECHEKEEAGDGFLLRFALSEIEFHRAEELVSDGGDAPGEDEEVTEWRADGHEWIRRRVARRFDGAVLFALITRWAPPSGGDPPLWHVVHEADGDEEDLDEAEVREGLSTCLSASAAGRRVRRVQAALVGSRSGLM